MQENSVDARPILEKGLNEIGARLLRRVKQKTPVGVSQEGKLQEEIKRKAYDVFKRGK